jgi:D-isomer specific 2-hydroxyacid dehydrogenase, NAD binding domain
MRLEPRQPYRLFGELPLLDRIASQFPRPHAPMGGIMLVCVQHLLETTGTLIQTLVSLGLNPRDIYILGKSYSSNSSVEDRLRASGVKVVETGRQQQWGEYSTQLKGDVAALWNRVAEGMERQRPQALVVLDDGGFCIKGVPEGLLDLPVVGIEQTMSGLALLDVPPLFPVIDVASSAAKQWIEPPMISEAILARLQSYRLPDSPIGVVGFGNIGKAMTQTLSRIQSPILAFDENIGPQGTSESTVFCDSLRELFSRSAIIFGCTGRDTLAGKGWWPQLTGERLLISCSSQDMEFRSILLSLNDGHHDLVSSHQLTSEVTVPMGQGKLRILRGGFPVNFDGSRESVPAPDIQMTRGLLLGAILQAVSLIKNGHTKHQRMKLLPELQQLVVDEWIQIRTSRRASFEPWLLDRFLQDDLSWIADNSGGVHQETASERWTAKVH